MKKVAAWETTGANREKVGMTTLNETLGPWLPSCKLERILSTVDARNAILAL